MVRTATLKVYRTAIGFHDAYVAAASQKAALAAWGSDKNLFARGAAEIVTDPALIEEPLRSPGQIVKRLRGTAAEQMAALPPDKPTRTVRRAERSTAAQRKAAARKPAPPRPPPSRAGLEQAEAALESAAVCQSEELADLTKREAALAQERKQLLAAQRNEKEHLTTARDRAANAYDRAIRQWRAG